MYVHTNLSPRITAGRSVTWTECTAARRRTSVETLVEQSLAAWLCCCFCYQEGEKGGERRNASREVHFQGNEVELDGQKTIVVVLADRKGKGVYLSSSCRGVQVLQYDNAADGLDAALSLILWSESLRYLFLFQYIILFIDCPHQAAIGKYSYASVGNEHILSLYSYRINWRRYLVQQEQSRTLFVYKNKYLRLQLRFC